MKVLILAPGVGSSFRGYERLAVDMAAQLRLSGLDARCWTCSPAPESECVPSPGREELQRSALERMHQDPALRSISGADLHDWAILTEDQLFGIAAAARLRQEIEKGGPALVYLKWQGGLLDASGASTRLFDQLAWSGSQSHIRTVVHTDWVYAPIASRLARAGFIFHAVGPWISRELRDLGVPSAQIFEQPMGTLFAPFKNVGARRSSIRKKLGIPESAFVAVTVGAFLLDVKNFPYLVRDLAPLAADEDFYWVAAGVRGESPAPWEEEARALFGKRFVPLVNVPFADMPDVYGMADLSLLGSWSETFGLCYVEAQFCELPLVMHDFPVTQSLTQGLPEELAPISRVNMRAPGNAFKAVTRWRELLATEGGRISDILKAFRQKQEERFAWEHLGPRFAEIFLHIMARGVAPQKLIPQARKLPLNVLTSRPQPRSAPLAPDSLAGNVANTLQKGKYAADNEASTRA